MGNVRRATPDDIGALFSLETECFSSPWSMEAFAESMREGMNVFLVYEIDGKVVGYVGGVCALDECSITNVATSAEYRCRGVATSLLCALESTVAERGVRDIFLEVRVSNARAISVYEGRGYERCGVRRNFYRKPTEDAYVYKKSV